MEPEEAAKIWAENIVKNVSGNVRLAMIQLADIQRNYLQKEEDAKQFWGAVMQLIALNISF